LATPAFLHYISLLKLSIMPFFCVIYAVAFVLLVGGATAVLVRLSEVTSSIFPPTEPRDFDDRIEQYSQCFEPVTILFFSSLAVCTSVCFGIFGWFSQCRA